MFSLQNDQQIIVTFFWAKFNFLKHKLSWRFYILWDLSGGGVKKRHDNS